MMGWHQRPQSAAALCSVLAPRTLSTYLQKAHVQHRQHQTHQHRAPHQWDTFTSWCRLFPFIFLLLIPAVCLTLYDYVRKTGGPPPARSVYTVLMMLISTRTGDRFPVGHVPQNIGIILICVYWHHHLPSLPDLLIHRPRDPFAFPAIGHQCSAVQCRALTDWLSPPCFISASDLMKLIQQIWIVM